MPWDEMVTPQMADGEIDNFPRPKIVAESHYIEKRSGRRVYVRTVRGGWVHIYCQDTRRASTVNEKLFLKRYEKDADNAKAR